MKSFHVKGESKIGRIGYKLLIGLIIGIISGCTSTIQENNSPKDRQIILLQEKVKNIERKLNQEPKIKDSEGSGPIRSITFRVGTQDNRLRIYWSDGSYNDLLCTKEQSIWACG